MTDRDLPVGASAGDDDAGWAPRAAVPPPPPADVAVLLPGYRDAVVVARGGDSVVYRAHQEAVDRDVAIKVVDLDDTPDNAEALARFRRELDITVRLGRQHPHIMTVLAVGTTGAGRPCLVMDYFELGSVHDRIRARGPLPVSEVVAAGSVIADALDFAHAQGVLHRDVKPQNVLVLPTSWVLADFGLARAIDAGHSASLERFSYRHASPQILDGEKPTVADDVYSLGSTLFTMLDGRAPFAADDPDEDSALAYLRRARTEAPRTLARDDVPVKLAAIVARCLAKSREDRFASAAELRAALDALPTEERSWAPAGAPVPSDSAAAPVAEPAAAPPADPDGAAPGPGALSSNPPDTDEPPALPANGEARRSALGAAPAPEVDDFAAPNPVAVSALAHLPPAPSPAAPPDADATGRRPLEPPAAEPQPHARPNRRWWILTAVTAAALVVGVLLGVLRSGDDRPAAQSRPTPTPSTSGAPVVVVPSVSSLPSGPSGSAVFDPRLAPVITKVARTGGRVDLRWRVPAGSTTPIVVFLDDGDGRRALTTVPAERRGVTLAAFPTGPHCLRLAAVATTTTGNTVFGLSARRCVG